jgi:hypothetical protein
MPHGLGQKNIQGVKKGGIKRQMLCILDIYWM